MRASAVLVPTTLAFTMAAIMTIASCTVASDDASCGCVVGGHGCGVASVDVAGGGGATICNNCDNSGDDIGDGATGAICDWRRWR